jgi:predicted nuclease with RNAse H fold
MRHISQLVVGIDVGAQKKGFHAVALIDGSFERPTRFTDPIEIVRWCRELEATTIAVDAPCGWSASGPSFSSRAAERNLKLGGKKIHCFATPDKDSAQAHKTGFYGWVMNGERLYDGLKGHFALYDGTRQNRPACLETFPHAVVCALRGDVVPAKPKRKNRLDALSGYKNCRLLTSVDFIDAALCAAAAESFQLDSCYEFGNSSEGIIVVPKPRVSRV